MFNWLKNLFFDSHTEENMNKVVGAIKEVQQERQQLCNELDKEKSNCCCGEYGCEKYEYPVVEVELELNDEELKYIEEATRMGGYVSKSEFIRDALRKYVEAHNITDEFGPMDLSKVEPDVVSVNKRLVKPKSRRPSSRNRSKADSKVTSKAPSKSKKKGSKKVIKKSK